MFSGLHNNDPRLVVGPTAAWLALNGLITLFRNRRIQAAKKGREDAFELIDTLRGEETNEPPLNIIDQNNMRRRIASALEVLRKEGGARATEGVNNLLHLAEIWGIPEDEFPVQKTLRETLREALTRPFGRGSRPNDPDRNDRGFQS